MWSGYMGTKGAIPNGNKCCYYWFNHFYAPVLIMADRHIALSLSMCVGLFVCMAKKSIVCVLSITFLCIVGFQPNLVHLNIISDWCVALRPRSLAYRSRSQLVIKLFCELCALHWQAWHVALGHLVLYDLSIFWAPSLTHVISKIVL